MTRILYVIILSLLAPIVAIAQERPEWLQEVERTAENPQIHSKDILEQLPDDNIIQHALRTPYVKPEYKVYDYAGILSESSTAAIRNKVLNMIMSSGLDAAVIFLNEPSWNDSDNEQFNMDFYDYNDFGCGDSHDGVCISINMATRRFAIFDTGLPETFGIAGKNFISYNEIIKPYFRSENYADGVVAFLEQFEADFIYERDTPWWCRAGYWVGFVVALLLALIITAIRSLRSCKIEKATLATNYEIPNSFRLTVKKDTLISTNTTKVYSPPQSSSGGGGHHSGSSGRSHSGGSGGW